MISFNRPMKIIYCNHVFFLKHLIVFSGLRVRKLSVPHTLDIKKWMKNLDTSSDEETQDIFKEQDYVTALDVQGTSGNNIFTANIMWIFTSYYA